MAEDVTEGTAVAGTHDGGTGVGADVAEVAPAPRRPGRLKRFLLWAAGVIAALTLLALVLYLYGSMQAPPKELRARYAAAAAAGQVPPVPGRFHIPIPGCVCHSTDPVQTMQHSVYRISECMQPGCHGGAR